NMAKKRGAQEAAFLEDICAHAEDDAPRLVFADWLEENGQPHRAEFIRLQCRLATMGEDDPERSALEDREWELATVYRDEWREGVPAWARKEPFAFRRGFVGRLSMTATQFLKHGEAPFRVVPLEELHLRSVGQQMQEVAASPLLRCLTGLDLSGNELDLSASEHL